MWVPTLVGGIFECIIVYWLLSCGLKSSIFILKFFELYLHIGKSKLIFCNQVRSSTEICRTQLRYRETETNLKAEPK